MGPCLGYDAKGAAPELADLTLMAVGIAGEDQVHDHRASLAGLRIQMRDP